MWRWLMVTERDWSATVLRAALGLMIFAHGLQKVFGIWGGAGLGGTLDAFSQYYGVTAFWAVVAIVIEFVGGLALLAGFYTRLAALAVGLEMFLAAFIGGHVANGFFMNWTGQAGGEGFEFHILAVGIAVALAMRGGGALSVDRAFVERDEIDRAIERATIDADVPVEARRQVTPS